MYIIIMLEDFDMMVDLIENSYSTDDLSSILKLF